MLAILLSIIAVLTLWLLVDSRKKLNYWRERGIAYVEPLPIIGNSLKVVTMKQNQALFYQDVYDTNPDKDYVGIYEFTKPALLIRSPDIIGRMLVKDFGHFIDHGFNSYLSKSEVDAGLFFLEGNEWRAMRLKMIPTFTTGKLRNMFPEMVKCSERVIDIIDRNCNEVDVMEVSTAYTMNMIASCAFGIEIPADASTEFRQMGKRLFEMPLGRYFRFLLMFLSPKIAERFKMTFTPTEVGRYFSRIIKDTMQYRIDKNVTRNDFIQLLVQLKLKGSMEFQSKDVEDDYLKADFAPPTQNIEITENLLVSQAFAFLTAGFEGATVVIMYTLLGLAQDKELQDRVRSELQKCIEKHGGLTYDALKEAKLLAQCVDETLRMNPLAPMLLRVCNKRYEIEDGVFIEPGTKVVIPITGLHFDSKYWTDPKKYDPERFSTTPQTNTYLPFSDGPRMCIGMRFALVEIKLGVATILKNYHLTVSPKTKLPVEKSIRTFIQQPKNPVLFNLTKLLQ